MAEFTHKCNTCLAAFPNLEALKEHYRGDWHVLNSKRRAGGAAPIKRDHFLQLLAAAPVKPVPGGSNVAPSSSSASRSNTASTKTVPSSSVKSPEKTKNSAPAVATKSPEKKDNQKHTPTSTAVEKAIEKKEKEIIETLSTRTVVHGKVETEVTVEDANEEEEESGDDDEDSVWEDEDSDEDGSDDEEGEGKKAKKDTESDEEGEDGDDVQIYEPKLGTHISLFDDKDCGTMDKCLTHMAKKYGFFLPDSEYITDLNGMMEYLGEKVKLGGICLFCQKRFPPGPAVQHHMIGKSHCKIAYEEGVDLEELEDFYDFTATYDNAEDVEYDSDGEVIQEEAEVDPCTGELILPDGRVLGHRQFRRYYKQYYRLQDTREPVIAQQREELLRLGMKFGETMILPGGSKGKLDAQTVAKMGDGEVMASLIKYHKQIRRGQMVEQKAHMHKLRQDQRREYNSKIDKMRSSETTTAKIRDYHGLLK